jgi:hypothetical protein
MRKQVFGVCLIAGLLFGVSSAPVIAHAGQGAMAMKEESLYDRLGKKKAIAAVTARRACADEAADCGKTLIGQDRPEGQDGQEGRDGGRSRGGQAVVYRRRLPLRPFLPFLPCY